MKPADSSSAPSPEEYAPPPGPGPEGFGDFESARAWLRGLIRYGIKYGLENFTRLLERLGHPERDVHWIHVAGTNGKGSVSAMIESVLRAHGKSTTLFTSPHLVSERERFRVDGSPVDDESFARVVTRLARVTDELVAEGLEVPTFFEACAAIAFLLAGERPGSWGVAECGLGGRLDATNLLEPEVAVIASVGLDHTKTLGSTLELIAKEKAGVAKPGRRLLVSPCISREPLAAIQVVAREKGAEVEVPTCRICDSHLDGEARRTRFSLVSATTDYGEVAIPLLGAHQVRNACLAVRACEIGLERAGETWEVEKVRRGLDSVHWPARFDLRIHEGVEVVLDAVHNPQGMEAFMYIWEQCFPGRSATVLFGACSDKSIENMLGPLSEFASEFVFATAEVRRACPAELLAERYAELGLERPPARATGTVAEAWAYALAQARQRRELLLVCGSLYLIGDVLALPDSPDVYE